jgi:hypothetical protein
MVLGLSLRAMVLFLCSSCSKCTSPDAPIPVGKATADAVIAPHVKRERVTADCRALEEQAELYSARAGHCKTDQDCCLIWDLEFFGCAAANRAEDLAALRDNIRARTRNCGRKDVDCQDLEPFCRKGRCEMRGARTPDPRGDDEPLLTGLRYDCRQRYSPAVKMLGLKSPGVVLLTDPRRDPWFGVELPDGGGYGAQVHVEVCVSEEGSVTSVRTLERAPEFPKAELQDKILDTWQFRPLIVGGIAKPFCVMIGYPMESWK